MKWDKVLIWDLDGTIADSVAVFEEVLADILPPMGRAVPKHADVIANYHGSLDETFENLLGITDADKLAAMVAAFVRAQDGHYEVIEPHIFPDAVRLARRAHEAGYHQAVVTNRNHVGRLRASPRHIIEHSSLADYIDLVIAGDDGEHRKPKPEVLDIIKDKLDGAVVQVIGDQFVDGQFALNLGGTGILVQRNEPIVHMDRLEPGWEAKIQIVKSLDDVEV